MSRSLVTPGTLCADTELLRPGRSTRAEFTQEDDDLLARYLCNTDPHAKGWKGQSFYERMVGRAARGWVGLRLGMPLIQSTASSLPPPSRDHGHSPPSHHCPSLPSHSSKTPSRGTSRLQSGTPSNHGASACASGTTTFRALCSGTARSASMRG